MKNRIKNQSKAFAWVSEQEWKKVGEAVAPSKRVTINVSLRLSPLQLRALEHTCRQTHTTPEEVIVGGLVMALDCLNSENYQTYKYGIVADALAQFPEREKELGELCNALNEEFDAHCRSESLSFKIEEAA
jgi:hypothetical protein